MGPKRKRILVHVRRRVAVAGRMVRGKLPQRVPVLALAVLLVARRVVAKQVQRRVVRLAHHVLPQHVDAVARMRGSEGVFLCAMDGFPESFADDCLECIS